jgi:putative GTP pyrophosphokinase
MTQKTPDMQALRAQYEQIRPKYEDFEASLKRDLQAFLDEAGIHVLEVQSRVKDFESLWDKANRKGYADPLAETDDLCALRVIALYASDLHRILEIIKTEFDVRKVEDKSNELGTSEFGYRSIHVILIVKQDWLQAPCYRGLGGLKAEVQLRTVLMHAWASVSHDLWYKRDGVPEQFEHELSRLDAILERVDDDFDVLRSERAQYVGELSAKAKESGQFDADVELNIDSLTALLDFRFPDKVKNPELTSFLLGQLQSLDMSMGDLLKVLDTVEHILPLAQAELVKVMGPWYRTQPATVLTALALTNEHLAREVLPHSFRGELALYDKWRAKLYDSRAGDTRSGNR